ncbi:MAG: serine/threonine protein phosphatase [Deltaproteobacteria bacterium]|nr:serine/threonine protein phosphatase [Deltaproteobacteria bacterium]MCW5801267.1 serine/threonine protein phosphatase [Deltaproteobacteria bacterium]
MLNFSSNPDVAEQQMNAIIFYLTAFGYIDGEFDFTEKTFVRIYIRQLVTARAQAAMPDAEPKLREEVVTKFVAHFHEVFEQIDRSVKELFDEAVADGEDVEKFVYARLKLRSYEIFQTFDRENQHELLSTVDELIYADGSVHPAEKRFRDELEALLDSTATLTQADIEYLRDPSRVAIEGPAALRPRLEDHPFFAGFEYHYSADPQRIRQQAASDLDLMRRFIGKLGEQRAVGKGRLADARTVADLAGQRPFLDGHVYVHPSQPNQVYELTVLGDLHGCYSCLKGALLQADFFAKLEAWRLDRTKPEPKLILLGDYIDRGRFSYNGVLRAVMQLFLAAPEHVFPLRGNHEYYIEYRGRIYGGVKPAEAINTLAGHMPGEIFAEYMKMFEELPNLLFFDDLMFVHAGIPRDADIRARMPNLAALNDPELRFQMLWSDPSSADYIPDDLQAQNARFPFGKLQFEAFMQKIGCSMMVRGHEKVDAGFRPIYGDQISLISVFSAGGVDNQDLPPDSSYRTVTPMAATIRLENGNAQVTPWLIDYKRFNDPKRNRFFASPPEIEHKVG